jgi:hypothetical protein
MRPRPGKSDFGCSGVYLFELVTRRPRQPRASHLLCGLWAVAGGWLSIVRFLPNQRPPVKNAPTTRPMIPATINTLLKTPRPDDALCVALLDTPAAGCETAGWDSDDCSFIPVFRCTPQLMQITASCLMAAPQDGQFLPIGGAFGLDGMVMLALQSGQLIVCPTPALSTTRCLSHDPHLKEISGITPLECYPTRHRRTMG